MDTVRDGPNAESQTAMTLHKTVQDNDSPLPANEEQRSFSRRSSSLTHEDATAQGRGESIEKTINGDIHSDTDDIEKGNPGTENILVIDWESPDDPANPRNWTYAEKWVVTGIISAFTFISPISSSMIAPAAETQVALKFHMTNTTEIAMITSVFILAYAFGPLFLGPLSELYGRSRVLQGANLWYLVWNLVCGFARNPAQLIVFRFLAGLGGSAPLAIGAGAIGDCWSPEERGQAIALFSLAPLLGPVLGPLTGSWIAEKTTWKWVFWSTTIVDGVIQILGLFLLRETYAPVILDRKAKRVQKEMDLASEGHGRVLTKYQLTEDRNWRRVFTKGMVRPFVLFAHEPIIQLLGAYLAFVYGLIYLILTTIPSVFTRTYGEQIGIAGLNYLALGIGLSGASQIAARQIDRIYRVYKEKNGGVGKPEFRLPPLLAGSILLPIGLLVTGWCSEKHVHWIATDIGLAITGAGIVLNNLTIQTYIVDAFTLYAASAIAASSCLRSIAGFGFPLFASDMYNALGYGKGNTILAAIAIGIGCPAPWIFWFYGERIRLASRHAAKSA